MDRFLPVNYRQAQKSATSDDRVRSRARSRRVIPHPFHHLVASWRELYSPERTEPKKCWLGNTGTSMGGDEAIY